MNLLSKFALSGLFAVCLAGAAAPAQAQININIIQPSWGPAVPAGSQYYYIPDIDGYYDLRAQRYIVYRNNSWTRLTRLNGYNPANFHPVVINYVGAQPWVLVKEHRVKYKGHPHGMPPGQAKKARAVYAAPAGRPVYVVEGRGGKGNGGGHGGGHGGGKGNGKGKH